LILPPLIHLVDRERNSPRGGLKKLKKITEMCINLIMFIFSCCHESSLERVVKMENVLLFSLQDDESGETASVTSLFLLKRCLCQWCNREWIVRYANLNERKREKKDYVYIFPTHTHPNLLLLFKLFVSSTSTTTHSTTCPSTRQLPTDYLLPSIIKKVKQVLSLHQGCERENFVSESKPHTSLHLSITPKWYVILQPFPPSHFILLVVFWYLSNWRRINPFTPEHHIKGVSRASAYHYRRKV